MRWEHERRGLIPPSEFIPVFEKSEKILKLDLYVFTQVCRWQKDRMERGEPLIPVSVNLSRRHFQRPGCLEPFEEEARRCAIPRGLLEFELTESIFFDDRSIEDMKDWIGQMHRMGFLCSLDDFGSGYSSLGLLASFRVDAVKLDRRFFPGRFRPPRKERGGLCHSPLRKARSRDGGRGNRGRKSSWHSRGRPAAPWCRATAFPVPFPLRSLKNGRLQKRGNGDRIK